MYSQNHAPWAPPGPANQMSQGPRPGSTQQPWGQQQQQSQPIMQNSPQFPGFHSGPSGQQLWNGGQQNSANQPPNQASGQPWTPGITGGPEQQPQNFPPYYQQQQQQAQQQPQPINQPQFGQSQQQGQQQFHDQQPSMRSSPAPWGGQQNQPWQQQAPSQQQQMQQQQMPGPQGMPGPKSWIGTVTELIPPNYGIVDGEAFFVNQIVVGNLPQVGEKVSCDAIVNTDGGRYQYRCTRVQIAASMPAPLQPNNSNMGGFMGPGARPMLPSDYKLAPPPTNAYQTDLALAAAANSMTPIPMQPSVVPPRRVFSSALKLDEEARRRSEMATKQLMQNYHGPPNVGIKLMSKMGYGVAGTGLGAKGQGIAAPVQPVSLDGNSGLGFQMPPPLPDRRPLLRRRSPPPQRRIRSPPPRRGRSPSPSRIHHRSSLSRSESRSRSQSPRSPPRHGGRYKCEPPKSPPYPPARTIPDVSKRYGDMYIPPEFCRVTAGWVDSLPDHKPLSLEQPIDFQVKKEDQPTPAEPVDKAANASGLSQAEKLSGSWWSAKVVLMSGAHSKVLHAEDPNAYQQTWKKLQFVVGRRGKHELLAVGGMWEPCDGAHPEKDPQVLVKTAARAFKEASGVDLSKCTKWHKFVEYSYLRAADKKHEVPEHIEKTVLFLVDASAIAVVDPEAQDWGAKASSAQEAEQEAAAAVKAAWHAAKEAKEAAKELDSLEKAKKEARKEAAKKAAADKEVKKESGDSTPARALSNSQPSPKAASGNTSTADLDKGSKEGHNAKDGVEEDDDCTPRDSEGNELGVDIDTSKLTAAQLQEELTKRGLDVKWQPLKGKKVLVDRLQEWMAMHRGKKEAQDVEAQRKAEVRNAVEPAAIAYEEAKKVLRKASTDRRAAVRVSNDPPPAASLALWPNKDFLDKRTRFGLEVLPLEALLDYNEDDTKECHFEVSMFAEMFREMLQTRFARGLIRGMAIIEHQTEVERSKEKERVKEREKGKEREARQGSKDDADTQKEDESTNEQEMKSMGQTADEAAVGASAQNGSETKEAEVGAASKDIVMLDAEEDKAAIDASQEPDSSTAKAVKPAIQATVESAPAVSKNSEMVEAEQAIIGTKNKDGKDAERGSRGVKRPAEEEAGGGQNAAALTVPPSAKRHKTDAEWGKSSSEGAGDPFLLACRFFDRECAGYLDADDLEEIAFMVSDGISRRRVQMLVDHVTKHGKLRYLEHSQLRIPPALPPVGEEMKSTAFLAAAAASGPAVSDKEWKALLGKLASSEKVRRAADASIAAKDEEAAKAAEQYQELQAEEQKAQAQIRTLKEQLTGMRSSRFRANDLLSKGLDSVQSNVAQLNALKEQMEGAQAALRKVETPSSRVADGQVDNKA